MASTVLAFLRALIAPHHVVACRTNLWRFCLRELAARGQGQRESGAFLLGHSDGRRRIVRSVVFYDDLDPGCLTGGITFNGSAYPKLWRICAERQQPVIADVHTHPGRPNQSYIDQSNPMMPQVGHIAIIVPNFAHDAPRVSALGIYVYLGAHKWRGYLGNDASRIFYVGWIA
jgi:proteasome lid subunit RPN8/RPN11